MAIHRTYINSRADFFSMLTELTKTTDEFVLAGPNYGPMQSIQMQLAAIQRWTANGRDPTRDERKSIAIGQIIVRELEPAPNNEVEEYTQRLGELNAYFKEWLTDEQLASLNREDIGYFYGLDD